MKTITESQMRALLVAAAATRFGAATGPDAVRPHGARGDVQRFAR